MMSEEVKSKMQLLLSWLETRTETELKYLVDELKFYQPEEISDKGVTMKKYLEAVRVELAVRGIFLDYFMPDIPKMEKIEENDPLKIMIAKHPEAMTGKFESIKLSWVIGQGYSFMLSESYLGGFLMNPIRLFLRIKYWFKERTK